MADFVFPEDTGTGASDGDFNDAANFAAYNEATGLKDFVVNGMNFTLDAATPALDISNGKAVVTDGSATAGQSSETRDEGVSFVAEMDARTGLSLTDGDVNHVFLSVDLSTDDTINIVINTTNSAPAEPSLKLGTVDTTNDTTTELNRDVPIDLGEVQNPTSSVDLNSQGIVNVGSVTGLDVDDDENVSFGTGNDFELRFDSANTRLEIFDSAASSDTIRFNVNGDTRLGTNLDMGGNSISNVTSVDGVDVSNHSSRHQQGGSDSIEVDTFPGNNGANGEFLTTDGSNLSFAVPPKGMTSTERQAFNDVVAQLARNDFADNLDALNYDGGFFEIWRDRSKINIVTTPFDLSSITFDSEFDVSSNAGTPEDIAINSDGTKLFLISGTEKVESYNLSTAFDVSTASFNQSFDVSSNVGASFGIAFNDIGDKMYISDAASSEILSYTLSTDFDISTASFSESNSFSEDGSWASIDFNDTGDKMYLLGRNNDTVYSYNLSTAFDLSTASFNNSFAVNESDEGLELVDSGQKMFIVNSGGTIRRYSLSTAYDISTASLDNSADISTNSVTPSGVLFNDIGDIAFVSDDDIDNEDIVQYIFESEDTSNVTISTLDGGDPDGKAEIVLNKVTTSRDPDNATADNDNAVGLKINPNNNIDGVQLEVSSNTGTLSEIGITDSNGNKLDYKTGSFTSGDQVNIFVSLSSNTNYYVYGYDGGNTYTQGLDNSPAFPYTGTDLDITDGADNILQTPRQRDNAYLFISVSSISRPSSASFTTVTKDLSTTENGGLTDLTSWVISQDADLPTNTDIQYTVRDENSNTVTATQSDVDTEVDVSGLTGTTIEFDVDFSTSDSSVTPTLFDHAHHFQE